MNIDLVIAQVKAIATYFAGNVAGAAAYAKAIEDQAWLPPPAAYVIPLDMDAGDNSDASGLYQTLSDRIGVVVAFDNSADRRGQGAAANLDLALASIFSAILNWRPDSTIDNPGTFQTTNPFADHESRGFRFDGGRLLEFDRGRLFYQFDFALDRTITDADGWMYSGTPLVEIGITFGLDGTIAPYDTIDALITLTTS